MQRTAYFFSLVRRSALDLEFYKELLKKPFSFSLKYFFLLSLTVSAVSVLVFAIQAFPTIANGPRYIEQIKTAAQTAFPEELVLTIKNGELSTNVAEPYYIDIPELATKDEGFEHFITIDTSARAEDYPSLKSGVLVTRTAVVYPDRDNGKGGLSVRSLSEFDDMVIDKTWYDGMFGKIEPYVRYLPAIFIGGFILLLILAPFFLASFAFIGRLIFLAIIALFLFLFAKVAKARLGYKNIYQLTLHGATLLILAELLRDTVINRLIPLICIGSECAVAGTAIQILRNYLFVVVLLPFMIMVIWNFRGNQKNTA